MTLDQFTQLLHALPDTPQMPALFVGHGSPMNAIENNTYTQGWKSIGKTIPRPKAILSISAHWLTEGTQIHTPEHPKIIHDFWGFPKELYDLSYPATGSPTYAHATQALLCAEDDTSWGLDHGTWVVLKHMYPDANIPVFQMSIDISLSHQQHYDLGNKLMVLRKKGVLIMGSGNIVHNLGKISWEENAPPSAWAEEFDCVAKEMIEQFDHVSLINYHELGLSAQLSIPSPDHFWPLLYILGLATKSEDINFPVEGIAHGSISMRSVKIG